VGFLIVGLQLVLGSIYQGLIYPGVKVAGVDLSGLTVEHAYLKLQQSSKEYAVNIQIKDKKYRVTSEQLGAHYDYQTTAKAAFMVARNHKFTPLALLEARKIGNIGYAYTLDKVAHKSLIQKIIAETGVAPTNASVAVVNGNFEVRSDKTVWL
jgi:hypothetical protein